MGMVPVTKMLRRRRRCSRDRRRASSRRREHLRPGRWGARRVRGGAAMTPAALLADLQGRGIALLADGDDLRFRAPRGVMSEPDREMLTAAKPALLAVLREREAQRRTARHRELVQCLVPRLVGTAGWAIFHS